MFLKRLELNGFKSFASGIAMEFAPGLTAIVGPNGSGKSNVVDAMRWALGEQSMKRVRSSEGADLIFSGSESAPRKGKATVKMVFENAGGRLPVDAADVEVERSVNRDGTSAFRINRESVRLSDIVELLAHGNVGHRSTAVINQGMEAEILRAGPAELRDILEESSGVKPLQIKRQRSERRLRAALRNRREAQTLLREMRPHLRFLEGQMQRVEALRGLQEKYGDLSQSLAHYRSGVLARELERLDACIEDTERRLEKKEKELRTLEAEQKKEEAMRENPAAQFEERRRELEERRRGLEKRQAVLEARMEIEHEVRGGNVKGSRSVAEHRDFLQASIRRLGSILAEDDLASQRSSLEDLLSSITVFLGEGDFPGASVAVGGVEEEAAAELASIVKKLGEVSERIASLHHDEKAALEGWRGSFLKRAKTLRLLEGEARDLREERRNASWNRGRQQELDAALEDMVGAGARIHGGESLIADEKEARKAMDDLRLLREKRSALEEGDEEVSGEYEEVRGRVAFFEEQIADLNATVTSLEKVVNELDQKMKTQFAERLEVINEQFHQFFRMLFGGGKAALKTVRMKKDEEEEEEDALEVVGLEITAQLPGKRTDDLTSFSGGEKALTSIALLFAIISANPPPFLVLDEVDATLDESNAQRFCKILRDFGDRTQFILITHNRETMREADLLYGVTMGGDGVSQVLSLKLEKVEQYAAA